MLENSTNATNASVLAGGCVSVNQSMVHCDLEDTHTIIEGQYIYIYIYIYICMYIYTGASMRSGVFR